MKDRRAIGRFTRFAARCRRRRRIVPAPVDGSVKVNLGCGLNTASRWTNVDVGLNALVAKWPRPALRLLYRRSGLREHFTADGFADRLKEHDFCHHHLTQGLPFPDESVDYAYSSHFLEHLFVEEASGFIGDVWRVLKPNRVLRVCVPDLEVAVRWYRDGDKQKALRQFYPPIAWGHFAQHPYLYDFDILRGLLEREGSAQILRCEYRQGTVPDLDRLDAMPDETLYVEALRPA